MNIKKADFQKDSPISGRVQYVKIDSVNTINEIEFSKSGKAISFRVRSVVKKGENYKVDIMNWVPVSLCRVIEDPIYGIFLYAPSWFLTQEGIRQYFK